MIDEKQLIQELHKWDMQDLYLPIHFEELVEAQPSFGTWIPCKKELPKPHSYFDEEEPVPVMATYKSVFDGKAFTAGQCVLYMGYGVWKWFDETLSVSEMEDVRCEIIAWQPLPEPYKEIDACLD